MSVLLSLHSYTALNTTSDFPDYHLAAVQPRCPLTDTQVPVSADTLHAKEQNEFVPLMTSS